MYKEKLQIELPSDAPVEIELGKRVSNIVGNKYGQLTVLYPCEKKNGRYFYYCQCDCGNFVIKEGGNLKKGLTTSCGCAKKQPKKTRDKSKAMVDLVCPICGKAFQRSKKSVERLKNPPCCSKECSLKNRGKTLWKKPYFENPHGNFKFTQEDLDKVYETGNNDEKILPVECLNCGSVYYISYREYQDILSKNRKGIKAGRCCGETCRNEWNKKNKDETSLKRAKTNLERYGVDVPLKSREVLERLQSTVRERYGVSNPMQNDDIKRRGKESIRAKTYETFKGQMESRKLTVLSEYEDYVQFKPLKMRCEVCGETWETQVRPQDIRCPNCMRKPYSEKLETVLEYVKKFYDGEIQTNVRNVGIFEDGRELDIYIPDLKLAFEFNGNYYHNDGFVDKNAHLNKTLACREKGIRLIHIFEYEWDGKQEKMKSLIRKSLGYYERKIQARKCKVTEIDFVSYNNFLETYHLQGGIISPIRYGLYYGDELISVIGFGKSRFKENEIELHRFCVKDDIIVMGGFSKLIKYANLDEFYSFVDLTHYDARGYYGIGFEEIERSKPNYVWFKNNEILTRLRTQKHKLSDLLGDGYEESESESENMERNGYSKIHDCGNLKVRYKRK